MSDAGAAYRAAQREIARVAEAGGTKLQLFGEEFRALERIPPEVADLATLQSLVLSNTRVSDLSPLTALSNLGHIMLDGSIVCDLAPLASTKELYRLWLQNTQVADLAPLAALNYLYELRLDNTQVRELSPLAELQHLHYLSLQRTQISDLSPLTKNKNLRLLELQNSMVSDLGPLAPLTRLRRLMLNRTRVTDLRPINSMTELGVDRVNSAGLSFREIPATRRDARLAELSEVADSFYRARETLAYLRSLPPWPEPYTPAATADGSPPEPIGGERDRARIPAPVPAPLEVQVVEGRLVPKPSASMLSGDVDGRARQAWSALRNYLGDLDDLRPRIGNQMPALERVLQRLDVALAQDYHAANQIELGMLGERVIAQAGAADETMAGSDAAELKVFAVHVVVFLERLPDWRTYRDDDTAPAPPPAPLTASVQPALDMVFEELLGREEIDPAIPAKLREQSDDLCQEPVNWRLLRGFRASFRNVLGALAERASTVRGLVVEQAMDVAGQSWKIIKKTAAVGIAGYAVAWGTGIDQVALAFFGRMAVHLRAVAQADPIDFGWLVRFLDLLGF